MRISSARMRTGTYKKPQLDVDVDPRISVSLPHLRSLEGRARSLTFLPRQLSQSVLNGRHASRLRGRGLNFEELRGYLPGDDIRSIDWKVTARTGEPHVRVYTEERDRPTLIIVDQRMSMFFGSVLNMKSVTAAETAALAAFRILDQGDRVGGIVFGDEQIAEIRPERNRAAVNRFLTALADANSLLRADAPSVEPISMTTVLRSVSRLAPRNHLVMIFSDFAEIDDETHRLVAGIARRNDLVLGLVTDPIALEIPEDMKLFVSDGDQVRQISALGSSFHRAYV